MNRLFFNSSILLILTFVFFTPVFLFSSSENGLLGKNLQETKSLIQLLNKMKRSKNPYSIPKVSKGTLECAAGKTLINFENRRIRVQAESTGSKKIERIDIYFISPLSKQEAIDFISDFAPGMASANFKESPISPEEGNECTPRDGGVRRVYDAKQVVDLFYPEAKKDLIQEARIYPLR